MVATEREKLFSLFMDTVIMHNPAPFLLFPVKILPRFCQAANKTTHISSILEKRSVITYLAALFTF